MADENTNTIDQNQTEPASTESYSEAKPVEVNVETPIPAEMQIPPVIVVGEAENIPAEIKTEEVPVVSEAEPLSSTIEPSIQDEVVKVEEEPVKESQVIIEEETPVVEIKPQEAEIPPVQAEVKPEVVYQAPAVIQTPVAQPNPVPVVAPISEPVTPIPAPEPVTTPTHTSPLEALGAVFVANMKRARELLVKARAAIFSKRQKKIDKIMTLFLKKSKIVNQDVRELLHTTEHTSIDYLNILVKDGKIKKEGKSNHTYYTKV